ncbi:hypothetical protein V8E55_011991 [Tylopilus felleus]
MYVRFSALLPIAALAALAVVAPNALEARDSQCSTGELQCCQSTQTVRFANHGSRCRQPPRRSPPLADSWGSSSSPSKV